MLILHFIEHIFISFMIVLKKLKAGFPISNYYHSVFEKHFFKAIIYLSTPISSYPSIHLSL